MFRSRPKRQGVAPVEPKRRVTPFVSPPQLKPLPADIIEDSTEPTAACHEPVDDITIEPISDLATVVPVTNTPIADAPVGNNPFVDAGGVDAPVADSPTDEVGSGTNTAPVEVATESRDIDPATDAVSAQKPGKPTLVDHAPKATSVSDGAADTVESNASQTRPAAVGRWDRLLSNAAATTTATPPPASPPETKATRGRWRARPAPAKEMEPAEVVVEDVEPTTTEPIVGITAETIAESASETPDGRWGRLIADSVARSDYPTRT